MNGTQYFPVFGIGKNEAAPPPSPPPPIIGIVLVRHKTQIGILVWKFCTIISPIVAVSS